jgi:hypothetical protein
MLNFYNLLYFSYLINNNMFQYQIADPICRQEIPFVSGRFLMSAGDTFFWWEITFSAGRSLFTFCQPEIPFVKLTSLLLAGDSFC